MLEIFNISVASGRGQDPRAALSRDRACRRHHHVRRDLPRRGLQGQEEGTPSGRNRRIPRCCHSSATW